MSIPPNVLASRYASQEMQDLFSEEGRFILEREFWVAVLKAQKDLGLTVHDEVIEAYEKVIQDIDLDAIRTRERKLRHDVKSRIEIFSELAGYQQIHQGMTSRDLTDNVEQLQIYRGMRIILHKAVKTLDLMSQKAKAWDKVVICGRTHNVPAQPTTMGKRIAMFGQDLLLAVRHLEECMAHYPLRGLKGAVGTLLDQQTLLNGDEEKVLNLQKRLLEYLDFPELLSCVGQVYPRSLDMMIVSALYQLGSGPVGFCKTLRLMAGHDLATEGFQKGQVGSSAMPHKMNARNSERTCGLHVVLRGYLTMAEGLAGDQWNEGDVSCSVVRRVMLPDAFFATDGLFETVMTIFSEMQLNSEAIEMELKRTLPFLATTTLLMHAIQAGAGRENAHSIIQQHAGAVIQELRQGRRTTNNLLERLGADNEFPLNQATMEKLLENPEDYTGQAVQQVASFAAEVGALVARYPESTHVKAAPIL